MMMVMVMVVMMMIQRRRMEWRCVEPPPSPRSHVFFFSFPVFFPPATYVTTEMVLSGSQIQDLTPSRPQAKGDEMGSGYERGVHPFSCAP